MFKNFDKVFKFTFRNQALQKGYKALTITFGAILLIAPILVLIFISWTTKSDENVLQSCGADKIYVVNEAANVSDYSALKSIPGDGYASIEYIPAESVEGAVDTVKNAGEKKSLVLYVTKDENGAVSARVIIPEGSEITSKTAKNYNKAIDKMEMLFTVTMQGISIQDMTEITRKIEYDGFDASGWKTGTSLFADKEKANEQNNERIRDGFGMIITLLICLIMYFVVMAYGASISKNIVLEKASKLMDTMLISVKPEALVFGKLTGVLAAGLLQFFFWILMLAAGLIIGVKLSDAIFPDAQAPAVVFLKSLGAMNMFQPLNVFLAVIVLLFGIIMYCAMAAFAGAISSTMEQAASNQGIFAVFLLFSYFAVIIKGTDINSAPMWLFLVPFTAALILPTGLLLGTLSLSTALIGVAILVVLTLVLLILAGHIYKAMALYKGDTGIRKVFKILTTK
ncbi:MAG: ABC transporter permease [Eubacterium sp.]|nr:ABC transporter permease [Eubacterium sp.]